MTASRESSAATRRESEASICSCRSCSSCSVYVASTLAVSLGEEPDTIEDVYEPYLLQLGFIQRTPRGRTITKLGRAHVGAAAEPDAKLF